MYIFAGGIFRKNVRKTFQVGVNSMKTLIGPK